MEADKIKRITLSVEETGGADRQAWPVTQGIPFAQGDLPHGASVRVVTDAGESLPSQTACLAKWDKDSKFVKWLLLDTQVDLAAGESRMVYLEYGPGVPEKSSGNTVTVQDADGFVRVDTGTLGVAFRRDDPGFAAELFAHGFDA